MAVNDQQLFKTSHVFFQLNRASRDFLAIPNTSFKNIVKKFIFVYLKETLYIYDVKTGPQISCFIFKPTAKRYLHKNPCIQEITNLLICADRSINLKIQKNL